MKLGLGIDTGGTYTDAVLYNFDTGEVASAAKAPTTKENLEIGILQALDALDSEHLKDVKLVSLSTTLATNACVEGRHGAAKLILIGGDEKVVRQNGPAYGLPPFEELVLLEGEVNRQGEVVKEPDWDAFLRESSLWAKKVCGAAVVMCGAPKNSTLEEKAKKLLNEAYGLPVVCGHELFSELNFLKRGAGALLNAQLIPIIQNFLSAMKRAMKKRGITAPVVIVRSDGSVMSERFASQKPVETILCGPAASVVGGMRLAGAENALVVDMGGTTTDVSIIRDGAPKKAAGGVRIGAWQTFVKSVYVDTFGLGGDSQVSFSADKGITVGPRRVVPLCQAAARFPEILEGLSRLVSSKRVATKPYHEFLYLQKPGARGETPYEEAIIAALSAGAKSLEETAQAAGLNVYNMDTERLEKEGILMRCGLTPTDVMHIKGDHISFCREASLLGAKYVARCCSMTVNQLCAAVYDEVCKALYNGLARVLLTDEYPYFAQNGVGEEMAYLLSQKTQRGKKGTGILNLRFSTPYTLVGVGAPIHIFLPRVAKLLHTKCVITPNAPVANAVGAVVGNLEAQSEVEAVPQYDVSGVYEFIIFTPKKNYHIQTAQEAQEKAVSLAKEAALAEVYEKGASGEVTVTCRVESTTAAIGAVSKEIEAMSLGIKAVATAVGRFAL